MTVSARFAELRRLFEQVCDLPPEARRGALGEATGDTALIAEVEALLAAETRGLRRVSTPVAALLQDMPDTELDAGDRVGAWRLVRKLASGGMGAVYLAERDDGHFQQQAAVKLLRGLPSAEALARLAAERQILARLQHPHIARLLDGGATPGGQPFLVLEYVEGVPIDAWCRDRALDLAARLRLFRNVCRAVAFAHQRLIVHCDLKPSNVLVRADGSPVLLDFGIARVLEQSREGAPEAFFTPAYASPEQIAGAPVSVASDVYSLGLILFELLTGRRARLDANDATVTQLAAAAVRPSDLADARAVPWGRRLRGDLDAIVLRATAERAGLRYASADALAEDIERYLDLRPVAARTSTVWYRYTKLVRRRWPMFAAGAVVVALSVLFGWRLVAERDRALAAEHEAREQAATAQQVSDFLVSVFQYANPEKNPEHRDITAREVLDTGRQRIAAELAQQPRVRAQLSDVLGRAYWQLGRPREAMALYAEAATLWQSSAVNEPLRAADSLSQLAVLQTNHHVPEAVQTAEAMVALRRGRVPDDDAAMADSWNTLALAQDGANRYEEAAANYARALSLRRRLFGSRSLPVAATLHNMALLELHRERPQQALPLYREALDIKRAVHGTERHPNVLLTEDNYARALSQAGHTDEAVEVLRRVIDGRRALDGADSENTAQAYNELGSALHDAGRFADAVPNYREALRIDALVLGKDSPVYAQPLNNLASAYDDMGDYAAAEPLFRESLAIRLQALGEDDPMVARAQQNLARVLTRAGKLEEARPLLEAALATRARRLGAAHAETVKSQLLRAEWLRRHGDAAAARAALDALAGPIAVQAPTLRAQRLRELARLDAGAGQWSRAIAGFAAAQELLSSALGADHPFCAALALEQAAAEYAAGQRDAAAQRLAWAASRVAAAFAPAAPERRQLESLQAALSAPAG